MGIPHDDFRDLKNTSTTLYAKVFDHAINNVPRILNQLCDSWAGLFRNHLILEAESIPGKMIGRNLHAEDCHGRGLSIVVVFLWYAFKHRGEGCLGR
jgi:hypothetical protein